MVALHGIDARSACKPLISGLGESERDDSTTLASGVVLRGVSGRRRKQSLATPRRISRRHLRGERCARPIGSYEACQLACGMEGRAAVSGELVYCLRQGPGKRPTWCRFLTLSHVLALAGNRASAVFRLVCNVRAVALVYSFAAQLAP